MSLGGAVEGRFRAKFPEAQSRGERRGSGAPDTPSTRQRPIRAVFLKSSASRAGKMRRRREGGEEAEGGEAAAAAARRGRRQSPHPAAAQQQPMEKVLSGRHLDFGHGVWRTTGGGGLGVCGRRRKESSGVRPPTLERLGGGDDDAGGRAGGLEYLVRTR